MTRRRPLGPTPSPYPLDRNALRKLAAVIGLRLAPASGQRSTNPQRTITITEEDS